MLLFCLGRNDYKAWLELPLCLVLAHGPNSLFPGEQLT